jgi:hypothetical protein
VVALVEIDGEEREMTFLTNNLEWSPRSVFSAAATLRFDSSAPDARQRERREQFAFGREADQFNQQEVLLRLDEQVPGTTQFAPYREFSFKLRRAFDSDFEEF